jgi:hypothetical protein
VSARFTFVPWVRSGAAAAIATLENVAQPLPKEATFDVRFRVNTQPQRTVSISLYGPGDIVGFDGQVVHGQVVRTEPRDSALDFEPNYFPFVEFLRPDLPWLFTPVRASGDVLRPWIAVVVVPLGAGVKFTRSSGSKPGILELANAGPMLPDLGESWAWAHAQVAGELGTSSVAQVLGSSRDRVLSRLVCPCRLQPDKAYVACVVPTTEAGRLAGLGLPVDPAPAQPAWESATQQLTLPVYYGWTFSTGSAGDFESLARLLQSRASPATMGSLQVDGSAPGIGLPTTGNIDFLGPLVAPGTTPGPSPPAAFQTQLRSRLDTPATLAASDPSQPGVIAPPLYGGLHAGRDRVPADRPHWLRELNLEPRARAAAGLGTQVVQEEQEQLMASAWDQVGAVEEANEALRRAQLARAASRRLHEDFAVADGSVVLQLTQPAHSRVRASPQTVAATVAQSALPAAALTPSFRRIARPTGPVARRLRPDGDLAPGSVVGRLNDGEIAAADPRRPPDGTVTAADAADAVLPSWFPRWLRPLLGVLPLILLVLAVLLLVVALVLFLLGLLVIAVPLVVVAAAALAARQALRHRSGRFRPALEARPEALTPRAVDEVPRRPAFEVLPEGTTTLPAPTAEGPDDSPAAAAFRLAARQRQAELTAVVAAEAQDGVPARRLDVGEAAGAILAAVDPRVAVPAAVLARIDVPVGWEPDDPIEPIMAAPSFPTPMYTALRDHFKELVFPGIDGVPQNSVTLLETNPRFIEAFMVGLNHEMGRELLWRDYPTDQRGTYFRQFWDPSGRVPAPATEAEREQLHDITPIHTWPGRFRLGDDAGRAGPQLVLLIRGQLLARYPTTVIYATKANARPGAAGRRPLAPPNEEERYPILGGRLPPDMSFLGFDLTLEEARGGPAPAPGASDPGPGWFFVLQQHPTEPRFGLDEPRANASAPATLADVTWGDVTIRNGHISLAATATGPVGAIRGPAGQSFGGHSANLAFATLQDPFRVAISADDMLPA